MLCVYDTDNPKRGSIMISYGMRNMRNIETNENKGKIDVNKKNIELTRHLFGENVPEPIWIESYFWENDSIGKKRNGEAITRAMAQPLNDM